MPVVATVPRHGTPPWCLSLIQHGRDTPSLKIVHNETHVPRPWNGIAELGPARKRIRKARREAQHHGRSAGGGHPNLTREHLRFTALRQEPVAITSSRSHVTVLEQNLAMAVQARLPDSGPVTFQRSTVDREDQVAYLRSVPADAHAPGFSLRADPDWRTAGGRSVPEVDEHGNGVGLSIRHREIGLPVGVQVPDCDGDRNIPRADVFLRPERSVPVTEKDGYGIRTAIGCRQVGLAVLVEISDCHEPGGGSGRIVRPES